MLWISLKHSPGPKTELHCYIISPLSAEFSGFTFSHPDLVSRHPPWWHQIRGQQVTITRFQRGTRQRPWGFISETCSRLSQISVKNPWIFGEMDWKPGKSAKVSNPLLLWGVVPPLFSHAEVRNSASWAGKMPWELQKMHCWGRQAREGWESLPSVGPPRWGTRPTWWQAWQVMGQLHPSCDGGQVCKER